MSTSRLPRPVTILTGAAVMMSIGMGMRQSLGLFLPPVTHDLALTALASKLGSAAATATFAPFGCTPSQLQGQRPSYGKPKKQEKTSRNVSRTRRC